MLPQNIVSWFSRRYHDEEKIYAVMHKLSESAISEWLRSNMIITSTGCCLQKPETVSTLELVKAIDSLITARDLYKKSVFEKADLEIQKAFRDACIQRFEYCIEFSWKVSMKILGSDIKAAKPAIREMARNDLIHNPEKWLGFIESRNDTSHAYDEDIARKVYLQIELFLPEATQLLSVLEKQN